VTSFRRRTEQAIHSTLARTMFRSKCAVLAKRNEKLRKDMTRVMK